MDVDPYGRENPLGPGAMLRSYRSGVTAIGTGLRYAAQLREQEPLDLSGIDAGLAVAIAGHQQELNQQAREFVDSITADFIQLVVGFGGFADLVAAFAADPGATQRLSVAPSRKGVAEQLVAISDHAGEIASDGDTAVEHMDLLRSDLRRTGRRLDSALTRAVAATGRDGVAASARIDALAEKVSGNIEAIVDGATEAGDAVTDLGIGILTEITTHLSPTPPTPSTDDSDAEDAEDEVSEKDAADAASDAAPEADADVPERADSDEEADGEDGDEPDEDDPDVDADDVSTTNSSSGLVPDVSFVVRAIRAGSKGGEKYAAAMAGLKRNNDLLAAQYQRLAAANRLVAIAKVTQVQKSQFAGSVADTAVALSAIRADWRRLRAALVDWSGRTDTADAAELARLLPGALKQWQGAAADVRRTRRMLTG